MDGWSWSRSCGFETVMMWGRGWVVVCPCAATLLTWWPYRIVVEQITVVVLELESIDNVLIEVGGGGQWLG